MTKEESQAVMYLLWVYNWNPFRPGDSNPPHTDISPRKCRCKICTGHRKAARRSLPKWRDSYELQVWFTKENREDLIKILEEPES